MVCGNFQRYFKNIFQDILFLFYYVRNQRVFVVELSIAYEKLYSNIGDRGIQKSMLLRRLKAPNRNIGKSR